MENKTKEIQSQINKTEENIKNTEYKSQKIQKHFEKIEETKANIYTDIISILGVFSGFLLVAFVGFDSIKEIGKAFSKTDISLGRLFITSSLLLWISLTLLYSLLHWVAFITGKKQEDTSCIPKKWHEEHCFYLLVSLFCIILLIIGLFF